MYTAFSIVPRENKVGDSRGSELGKEFKRLPGCFRQEIPGRKTARVSALLTEFNVHTVCQEARCPNFSHCFNLGELTVMILGDTCTRNCRFCAVEKSDAYIPDIDTDEPFRISQLVKAIGLNYVVVTSVTRDDLGDGGAAQFAKTVELIHSIDRNIKVEVLIPDFSGSADSLQKVIGAGPCVLAHNIETVNRLYKEIRPKADYQTSLGILKAAKGMDAALTTKSSLILGLGETEKEVIQAMEDLREAGCDLLTLGQYLAPGKEYYPVKEFLSIEQFKRYHRIALALGFKAVLSGPLVRSSYHAQELYRKVHLYV